MSKFYLYLDDSGTRYPNRKPQVREDNMDWFALGGILIADADRAALVAAHQAFMERWGIITCPLHSTAIRGKRDDFAWLGDDPKRCGQFLGELEDFLCGLPVIGFAAVIDRKGYNSRYQAIYGEQRWWMCKTAFAIVVERAAKYVDARGGTLAIRFEQTGKAEDRALQGYAKDLKQSGSPFDAGKSNNYGALHAADYARLLKGGVERQTKHSPAIQVADLYLYPMVKAGYDETYRPWQVMMKRGRLIDALLEPSERVTLGIKYSCFEWVQKRKAC